MSLVIKLGGHLLFGKEPNKALLTEYVSLLRRILEKTTKTVVVVGGGELSRTYIKAARDLGANEAVCDELGIMVSRINAHLLLHSLGDLAYPSVPTSLKELRDFIASKNVVVVGGFQPGQSTMAVAALAAETIRAEKLVVATDVDGIYTKDPKKSTDAKLIPETTFRELRKILEVSHEAGEYKLIDEIALKVLERSRIVCVYVNGKEPTNLEKAIRGEKIGTMIVV